MGVSKQIDKRFQQGMGVAHSFCDKSQEFVLSTRFGNSHFIDWVGTDHLLLPALGDP
ncbi:hypothetical protein K0H71_10495 [Bacillus sp. IITD106]|nr:hypothetical protein [Bacillus sp. IITD106]